MSISRFNSTMDTREINKPGVDCFIKEPQAPQAVSGTGVSFEEAARMKREIESLRARLAGLSEATLRVTGELDPGIVLQEVIDEARSLTGARYGALLVFDRLGEVEDFIISGIAPEERKSITAQPKGLGILGLLNEVQGPLRIEDLASHPKSIGFPENHPQMKSFLGCPVLHGGHRVSNIYLTEKEDGLEFTPEDEETIAIFALHASAAVANAHRYSEERQAKADLEALLNASPVGVLVFDARTMSLLSLNQEARRLVRGQRVPGRSEAEMLSVMSFQRPDGQEIPPDETPAYRAIRTGETVRAEEVVINFANGQSVSTIINATPVFSEEGEVVSVITTIQDMTPLERLERMRAEFIGMVSHELRTPLAAIKGSAATVLSTSSSLRQDEMRHFLRVIDEQADRMRGLIGDLIDMSQIEVGALSVAPESATVADIVEGAKRAFQRAGAANDIEADLPPDLPQVEVDAQRMVQVLNNLFVYASRNAPDRSVIRVSASEDDVRVSISVANQGRGVSADRLPYLFRKFPLTDGEVGYGQTVGENLGLVIAKGIVEAHGGRIWAEGSDPGAGTRFTFTIPSVDQSLGGDEQATDPAQIFGSQERTAGGQERILALDDEPRSQLHLRNTLREAGYTPMVTGNPDDLERLMETGNPDLVLLNPAAADGGANAMERIREFTGAPVIFMSARADDDEVARSFAMGADDYIVKPFSQAELVARIKAALRRQWVPKETQSPGPYMLADLVIDYEERRVTVAGQPVYLTDTEYRLLSDLSINSGRVLSHDQLLHRVWGPNYSGESQPVRTFVKNLRNKLGDDARNPTYIFTEPRVGYRMAKPEG